MPLAVKVSPSAVRHRVPAAITGRLRVGQAPPAKRGMPTMKFGDDASLSGPWPGAVILDVAEQRRTGPGDLLQLRQLGDEFANGQVFQFGPFVLSGRHRCGATSEAARWWGRR